MARPTHRLIIKDKRDNTRLEIGAAWPAKFDGAWSVKLGNTSESDEAKVEILVTPKNGKPYKVTGDSHFIDIQLNRPPKGQTQDQDENEEEDF